MTGVACIDNQACCGGGTNPNGTVICEKLQSADTYGRCDNGQACNPVGNICGAPFPLADGGTFKVNASQDCCDGKKEVCKRDRAGIPRCFGGGSTDCPTGYTGVDPCCIAYGQVCQFSDQCCNGAPCVPDSQGILRCSQSSCVPLGSACSTGGGGAPCCSGECIGDEFGTFCRIPTDAGTDASLCKSNNSPCQSAAECCSGTCSSNGTCQTPTQCQPSGAVCTATADCCTGFSCVIPTGSASGTCQAATCTGVGQTCTPTSTACCGGLNCLQGDGVTQCNGTTACTCQPFIG
jgi:hypothetical protein